MQTLLYRLLSNLFLYQPGRWVLPTIWALAMVMVAFEQDLMSVKQFLFSLQALLAVVYALFQFKAEYIDQTN